MTLSTTTLTHLSETGYPLSDYQKEDAERLANSTVHGLFLDTGLGKTIVSLAAIHELAVRQDDVGPIVIICPKIAVDMWAENTGRLLPGYSTHVVRSGTKQVPVSQKILIIPESLIARAAIKAAVTRLHRPILIIDESHYFKSPNAARTRAIYGNNLDRELDDTCVTHGAARVWLLSGTPMPNGLPGELYPFLRSLTPERVTASSGRVLGHFNFRQAFHNMTQRRFGRGRPVWVDQGAKNHALFAELLRPVTTRRRASDHLDLTEPLVEQYPLYADQPDMPAELVEMLEEVDADPEADPEAYLAQLLEAVGTAGISRLLRLFGEAKATAAAELVRMRADTGADRVLVGFWHRDVGAAMQDSLIDDGLHACLIDGATPAAHRLAGLADFESGKVPILLGQIKSMGVAINLQHCRQIVIAESGFVPGDMHQFIARCHRIGQKNRVIVDWTYLHGSLDRIIQAALARKTADEREIMAKLTT